MDLLSEVSKKEDDSGSDNKNKTFLLTLPRSDLGTSTTAISAAGSGNDTGTAPAGKSHDCKDGGKDSGPCNPLLLLQLPKGWKASDLIGCRFVSSSASSRPSTCADVVSNTANTNDVANDTTSSGSKNNERQQIDNKRKYGQASLIMESKGKSYDLYRVETSNALVVVPPLAADGVKGSDGDCDDPQNKRIKVTKTTATNTSDPSSNKDDVGQKGLIPVTSRLIKKGGSGSSFLELRERTVDVYGVLRAILRQRPNVLDPFVVKSTIIVHNRYRRQNNNDSNLKKNAPVLGRTLASMANELHVSMRQVKVALKRMHAFPLRDDSGSKENAGNYIIDTRYVVLSEEAVLMVDDAILSSLSEVDICCDYASQHGILLGDIVDQVLYRLNGAGGRDENDRFLDPRYAKDIAQHCVRMLAVDDDEEDNDWEEVGRNNEKHERIRLDVSKVARCVAKKLFLKQSSEWEESALLSKWQSELPGVGASYKVSMDMLSGIAICATETSSLSSSITNNGGAKEGRLWKYQPED